MDVILGYVAGVWQFLTGISNELVVAAISGVIGFFAKGLFDFVGQLRSTALQFRGKMFGYNLTTDGQQRLVEGTWRLGIGWGRMRVRVRIIEKESRKAMRYRGTCWTVGKDKLYFQLRSDSRDERAFFVFSIPHRLEDPAAEDPMIGCFIASTLKDAKPHHAPYILSFTQRNADEMRQVLLDQPARTDLPDPPLQAA